MGSSSYYYVKKNSHQINVWILQKKIIKIFWFLEDHVQVKYILLLWIVKWLAPNCGIRFDIQTHILFKHLLLGSTIHLYMILCMFLLKVSIYFLQLLNQYFIVLDISMSCKKSLYWLYVQYFKDIQEKDKYHREEKRGQHTEGCLNILLP